MEQHRLVRDGRRSAESWEDAALDAIAESGMRSFTIPALAKTPGVTKGSFYWYFDALDSLIAAALKRWENVDRETLDQLVNVADPAQRLDVREYVKRAELTLIPCRKGRRRH